MCHPLVCIIWKFTPKASHKDTKGTKITKEGRRGCCKLSKRGLHDEIVDKNPLVLLCVLFFLCVLCVIFWEKFEVYIIFDYSI
jgi:hypothetical protein